MASKWFFTHDGQLILGPFTSAKLKEFASEGVLLPTDKVRRVGKDRMVTAGRVKGLFAHSVG
jgi:hypothetical protein